MKLFNDLKIPKMNLSQRTKDILKGIGALLLIIVFTWAAVNIATNDQYEKNIATVNEAAKMRQLAILKELDSTKQVARRMEQEQLQIQNDIKVLNTNQLNLQKTYNTNFNQLKQIQKDEKIYIPAVTAREQLDFISSYRYTPVD